MAVFDVTGKRLDVWAGPRPERPRTVGATAKEEGVMDDKDEVQERLRATSLKLGVYRHYKGGLYVLFAESVREETLEPMVHYFSLEKKTRWTRSKSNFGETVVLPDNSAMSRRFAYDREATVHELCQAFGFEVDVKLHGWRV
jgi:hypothetical protein